MRLPAHLLFFFGAVVAGISAQTTCQFGSLTLQVGQSICNRTSQRVAACDPSGSLVDIDSSCRRFSPVCVLFTGTVNVGFETTLVGVGQSVCLQGTLQWCSRLYRTVTYRFRVRRGWRSSIRIIKRRVHTGITQLRSNNRSCEPDGCVVPHAAPQKILELNETRCIGGFLKTCDENFVLRIGRRCSCRIGHSKFVQEGETVCNHRLGVQSICVQDNGVFRFEQNGTCEVKCCSHSDCRYSVNETKCSYGWRFTCRETGRFQRTERCTCLFDGTSKAPFSKWCSAHRHYYCNGYGETRAIGYCRPTCQHNGRTYAIGRTYCVGRQKVRCSWNGTPKTIGICGHRRRRKCLFGRYFCRYF